MGLFGTGNPIIRMMNDDGSYTEVTLPLPNTRVPRVVPENVSVTGDDGTIVNKRVGVRFYLDLEYKLGDDADSQASFELVMQVLNFSGNVRVIPYSSAPWQEFVCRIVDSSESKGLQPSASQYGYIKLSFEGIHLLAAYMTLDGALLIRNGAVFESSTLGFDPVLLINAGRESSSSLVPYIQIQ